MTIPSRFSLLHLVLFLSVHFALCAAPKATDTSNPTMYSTRTGLPSKYARHVTRTPDHHLLASFMSVTGVNVWEGGARLNPRSGTAERLPLAGLPSAHITGFLPDAAGLLIITDRGLYRQVGERWQAIGPAWSWQRLERTPEQAVWVAGRSERDTLAVGRYIDGTLSCHSTGQRGHDLISLFPGNASDALIVTSTGLWQATPEGLRELDVRETPLWALTPRSVERRAPPVYLYDACRSAGGEVYLIGFFKRLVRGRFSPGQTPAAKSGKRARVTAPLSFDILAEGHFRSVAAIPGSDTIIVSDYGGGLYWLSGDQFRFWKRYAEAECGLIVADETGRLWVEVRPRGNRSHEMHLYAHPGDAQPIKIWSLGSPDGFLSPGLIDAIAIPGSQTNTGLWASTNEGLWHFEP